MNDTISRLDNISEGSQELESYQYLGLSTVVVRDDPQVGMELTYLQQSGDSHLNTANSNGGDQYTGLDRYGRVVDQNWISDGNAGGASGTLDREQYGYDNDGNVTSKTNVLNNSLSESYTYDALNRLTGVTRGGSGYQSWVLNSIGDMKSVTTGGTTTSNTTNSQNELTSEGSATLTYDNNGNTLTDDQGHTLVYDAWNRLISVENSSGTTLESYSYDGAGRQVTQTDGSGTRSDVYYSNAWQVLEIRKGGNTVEQDVWSPVYVNALLLRDSNTTGNPADGLNQRVYAITDANYNVVALVTKPTGPSTWQVTERFVYDAYPKRGSIEA